MEYLPNDLTLQHFAKTDKLNQKTVPKEQYNKLLMKLVLKESQIECLKSQIVELYEMASRSTLRRSPFNEERT